MKCLLVLNGWASIFVFSSIRLITPFINKEKALDDTYTTKSLKLSQIALKWLHFK